MSCIRLQGLVKENYFLYFLGTQDLSRSSFGNGGFAINARFHTMGCMTVDTVRNILYICDDNKIRAVNLTTNIITTVAGTGVAAYSGTGISALQANIQPLSIAIHPTSNMLYVGDVTNRIRVINMTTGIIFDYAGTGINGNTGDNGPCASANIRDPNSLAIDTANNLLFFGSYGIVRVINISNNTISAFTAATGNCEYSGDGGPALSAFLCAFAIAFDNANNVYVAAAYERIRLVNRAIGNINTIMGNGLSGYSGDGGPASSARIGAPNGVAIDKQNNILFVSDSNRVKIAAQKPIFAPRTCIGQPPNVFLVCKHCTDDFDNFFNISRASCLAQMSILSHDCQECHLHRLFFQITNLARLF